MNHPVRPLALGLGIVPPPARPRWGLRTPCPLEQPRALVYTVLEAFGAGARAAWMLIFGGRKPSLIVVPQIVPL